MKRASDRKNTEHVHAGGVEGLSGNQSEPGFGELSRAELVALIASEDLGVVAERAGPDRVSFCRWLDASPELLAAADRWMAVSPRVAQGLVDRLGIGSVASVFQVTTEEVARRMVGFGANQLYGSIGTNQSASTLSVLSRMKPAPAALLNRIAADVGNVPARIESLSRLGADLDC